jgi:spore maturation protein B
MSGILSLTAPLVISTVALYGIFRRVDVFSAVVEGAAKGLETTIKILPALVCLLTGIYMLRASGLLEIIEKFCAPIFVKLGIPPETASLVLLRPISGSGALAVGSELIKAHGADSFIGRCVAVMLGSTETTFYVIAIYFAAAGIKKSRHAIPAALFADIVGFFAAALFTRLFFK